MALSGRGAFPGWCPACCRGVEVDGDGGVEAVYGVVDAADEAGLGVAAAASHAFEQGQAEPGDCGAAFLREQVRRFGAESLQGSTWASGFAVGEGLDVQVGRCLGQAPDESLGPAEWVALLWGRNLDGGA